MLVEHLEERRIGGLAVEHTQHLIHVLGARPCRLEALPRPLGNGIGQLLNTGLHVAELALDLALAQRACMQQLTNLKTVPESFHVCR